MFNNSNMNYYYQNRPKTEIIQNSRNLNTKNLDNKSIKEINKKLKKAYIKRNISYKTKSNTNDSTRSNTNDSTRSNSNDSTKSIYKKPKNINLSSNRSKLKGTVNNTINNKNNTKKYIPQVKDTNSNRLKPFIKLNPNKNIKSSSKNIVLNKLNENAKNSNVEVNKFKTNRRMSVDTPFKNYLSNEFNLKNTENRKNLYNSPKTEIIDKKNPIREIDKLQDDEEIIENEEKYKDFEYYEDFCAAKRLKEKMANEEEYEKYFGNKTKNLEEVLLDYENYLKWITNYALEKEEPTLYNEFCINRNEIKYMLEKYSESNPKIKEIKKKFELIKYLGMYSDDKYENFPKLIEENGKIIALFRQVLNLEMKYISFSLFIATHSNCADLNDKLLELLSKSDLKNLKFRKDFKEMIKSFKENATQKDTPDPLKLKYLKFAEGIENLIKHNF